MKITLTHPAFVEARLKNGRSVKPSYIWVESEFDLTVIEPDQAPLAFEIVTKSTNWARNSHRQMRQIDGRLYLQDALLDKCQSNAANADDDPAATLIETCADHAKVYKRHTTGSEIFIRVHESIYSKVHPVANEVRPSGIFSALQLYTLPEKRSLMDKIVELSEQIEMTDEVVSQVQYWRQEFQRALDNYALIGTALYRRSGEPIYTASQSTPNALTNTSRPTLEIDCVFRTPSMIVRPYTETFSATERDRLDAYIDRFHETYEGCDVHITNTNVVVHDERFVSWNSDEEDLINVAKDVHAKLAKGISVLLAKSLPVPLPRSLFDVFLDLQDQIGDIEKAGIATDNLSETILEAERIWSETYNSVPRTIRKQLIDERVEISRLLEKSKLNSFAERFDNRTVQIAQTPKVDRSL